MPKFNPCGLLHDTMVCWIILIYQLFFTFLLLNYMNLFYIVGIMVTKITSTTPSCRSMFLDKNFVLDTGRNVFHLKVCISTYVDCKKQIMGVRWGCCEYSQVFIIAADCPVASTFLGQTIQEWDIKCLCVSL